MRKAGIIGYGWLGSRIAEALPGHDKIYTTTTSPDKVDLILSKGFHSTMVDFNDDGSDSMPDRWDVVADLDVLIITIPFSEKRSGADAVRNRFQKLASFIGGFNGQMFLMSSTGVYPDIPGVFVEDNLPSEEVLIESLAKKKYNQINILRLGGLMGDGRILKNFKVSNPDAVVNHIHYADICSVITRMVEKQIHSKLYNVVAPLHPTKREVLNIQNNILFIQSEFSGKKREISSLKMISELEFEFQYPDPGYFPIS
ncbi:Rossmann-fold NAD(P)-binding domain-containing protein [Chryseobacterium populi]|uniref:Uncharacterized protein n=1 Tax=Chryseobacterium populi TaxID=1144316 RepID=J3CES4_9FLAO|nr:hypothetical protein [Chryseobacterium populi]EJL69986.1 hypothetical protein PMI13_02995 [Chryseobacterium populi]